MAKPQQSNYSQRKVQYIRQQQPATNWELSDYLKNKQPVNLGVVRRQAPRVSADGAASAGASILGAAALTQPELLPVAAAAGVGYGIYKLGQSFSLW